MKKLASLGAAALLIGSGLVAGNSAPAAADATCNGTVYNKVVNDNVQVRSGATCTIINSVIKGDIKLDPNARLNVRGSVIEGNIQDNNQRHYSVDVTNSRIDGNIQLEGGQYTKLTSNRVGGDIQLWSNKQIQRVFRNTIDGNLQCKGNTPQPTGLLNTVRGNAEDQCRNLKQVTILTKNQGSTLYASNGRVTVSGRLLGYSTYGDLIPLGNQGVQIMTGVPGTGVYQTKATVVTAANGTYSGTIAREAGKYVRVNFNGWSTASPSSVWVGIIA